MSFVPKVLAISALLFTLTAGQNTLDGYAFDCGALFGFKGSDEIHCQDEFGGSYQCGSYTYDPSTSSLSGTTNQSPWTAKDLDVRDGVLVSFVASYAAADYICLVRSLDWTAWSQENSIYLKCPTQNAIIDVSYEENGYTLGVSGDAALRSFLEIVSGNGNTIVRDSFGVFKWHDDGSIKIYFGPQQGRPTEVKTGTMTSIEGLYVNNYSPPGPCVYDGSSPINIDKLPRSGGSTNVPTSGSTNVPTTDAPTLLGECEGNCGDDDDCEFGLICFQLGSDGETVIPGCAAPMLRASGAVCFDPRNNPQNSTSTGIPTPSPTTASSGGAASQLFTTMKFTSIAKFISAAVIVCTAWFHNM